MFYDHRAIKLTHNCVFHTNPCIILVTSSFTREHKSRVLEFLHLLQTFGQQFTKEANKRDVPVFIAFFLVFHFAYGNDHPSLPLIRAH